LTHKSAREFQDKNMTIVTTGKPLSWDAWVQAVEQLEAKAALAERNGLPKTAQSWRNMIANLSLRIEKDEM
jgi:hypothetical protein